MHNQSIIGIENAKQSATRMALAFISDKNFVPRDVNPSWVPDDNDDRSFNACFLGYEESEGNVTEIKVDVRIVCSDGQWTVSPTLTFTGSLQLDHQRSIKDA